MNLPINKSQWHALNELRGLPETAHLLVMSARSTDSGAVLDGSQSAFGELVEHIGSELEEGMFSGPIAGALHALCVKIDPECADWLGM